MKFRLTTLLLSIAFIGVAVGWHAEHARSPDPTQISTDISDSVQLGLVMGCTNESNRLLEQLDISNDLEFSDIRTKVLIENVLDMALYEQDAMAMQPLWQRHQDNIGLPGKKLFVQNASKSLELLGVSATAQFTKLLVDKFSQYGGTKILTNGSLDQKIVDFIEDAIQPSESSNDRE